MVTIYLTIHSSINNYEKLKSVQFAIYLAIANATLEQIIKKVNHDWVSSSILYMKRFLSATWHDTQLKGQSYGSNLTYFILFSTKSS